MFFLWKEPEMQNINFLFLLHKYYSQAKSIKDTIQ